MRRSGAHGRAAWLVPASVLALLLTMLAPTAASAASWEKVQLPGIAGKAFLLGVSCPSQSLCVAVGTNNLIASSSQPASGGGWNVVYAGEGASPYIPDNSPFISGRQIQAVSCPSTQLCVAVTDQGNVYSSTQPTGPASAWQVTPVDDKGRNIHLEGISCPSVSLCVAVSGGRNNRGKVLTSTNPAGGVGTWQTTQLDETLDLRGISCGSPSFCLAVGNDGRIVTSTNPTGGAGAWTVVGAPGGPGALRNASCVSVTFCLSGNAGGNLLTSTDPAGPLSSWSEINGGSSVQITGASCSSAGECLAVDDNGNALTSTNPSGGRSAWSITNLVPYSPADTENGLEGNGLFGASCPSRSLCVVTGALGQILSSSDPFAVTPLAKKPEQARRPKRPRVKVAKVKLPFHKQLERGTGHATIRFYANGKVASFSCKLDHGPFRRCRSPKRYPIGVGHHVFSVRATGMTGLKGPLTRDRFIVYPLCGGGFGRKSGGAVDAEPRPKSRDQICS